MLQVQVVANSNAGVFEHNIANNSATASFSQPPVADLAVQRLSVTPASATSGSPLTVSWQDANVGSAATSGSWQDQVTVVNESTGQTLFSQSVAHNGAGDSGSIAPAALDVAIGNLHFAEFLCWRGHA